MPQHIAVVASSVHAKRTYNHTKEEGICTKHSALLDIYCRNIQKMPLVFVNIAETDLNMKKCLHAEEVCAIITSTNKTRETN